jgi:hypothetical protein
MNFAKDFVTSPYYTIFLGMLINILGSNLDVFAFEKIELYVNETYEMLSRRFHSNPIKRRFHFVAKRGRIPSICKHSLTIFPSKIIIWELIQCGLKPW